MDTKKTMNEVQHAITEATMDMDTDAYCWFMRELAEWCNNMAYMQEYREPMNEDEEKLTTKSKKQNE